METEPRIFPRAKNCARDSELVGDGGVRTGCRRSRMRAARIHVPKPILRHLGRRYTRKFATTRLAPSENTEMCCGTSHSHATAAWTSTATRIKITRPSRQRRFQTSVRVWKNVRNEQWMLFHSEPDRRRGITPKMMDSFIMRTEIMALGPEKARKCRG